MLKDSASLVDTFGANNKTYQPQEIHPDHKPVRGTADESPPHCPWCASQGLSQEDDELFDQQFKIIVGAMRVNETHFSSNHTLKLHRIGAEQGELRHRMYGGNSWTLWELAQSALALLVIFVIGLFFINIKPVSPSKFSDLTVSSFCTTTGSLNADVTREAAIWSMFGVQNHNPVLLWLGDWNDELSLMQGRYDHCHWIHLSRDRLDSSDGLVLYNTRAPELDVARSMRRLRDRVCKFYQAFSRYPVSAEELGAGEYFNPVNGKKQQYPIRQVVNGAIVTSARRPDVETAAGSRALIDKEKQPGAVWAVNVKSDPVIAEDYNSYEWRNNCFYIYGNDRSGQPLAGGAAGQKFIIALKNGQDITEVQRAIFARDGEKVCFYVGTKPDISNIRWRYGFLALSLFLLAAATVLRIMHARSYDLHPARRRI